MIRLEVKSRYEFYDGLQEFNSGYDEHSYPCSLYCRSKLTTSQFQKIVASLVETTTQNALQDLVSKLVDAKILSTDSEFLKRQLALEFRKKELEHERKIAPPELILEAVFLDRASIIPNSTLDANEEAVVQLTVTNKGRGIAFDLKVRPATDYKNIELPNITSIGDIEPGESRDSKIRISAGIRLSNGLIPLKITCTEKRGYTANTIINIPAFKLKKPRLVVVDYKINDSIGGSARGNGNGVPESGEEFEFIPSIKNVGQGDAVGVSLSISSDTPETTINKSGTTVSRIAPGKTVTCKMLLSISSTFSGKEIELDLIASDKRGFSAGKGKVIVEAKAIIPALSFTYRVMDNKGYRVDGTRDGFIENGETGKLEIKVANSGEGVARDIRVEVNSDSVGFNKGRSEIDQINAGADGKLIVFPFHIPRTLGTDPAKVSISITQKDFSDIKDTFHIPHRPFMP